MDRQVCVLPIQLSHSGATLLRALMMADEEDFRINSLNRLQKFSSRLVLEQHSSCEVPAGCGGVVLQWRDPQAGQQATLRVGCLGQAQAWLDGVQLRSQWFEVAPGLHTLALRLFALESDISPLLVEAARYSSNAPGNRGEPLLTATGSKEGSWRYTNDPPRGDFTQPDFDDSSWPRLRRLSNFDPEVYEDLRFHFERLLGGGAEPLSVPGREAWIRHSFRVAS